MRAFLTLFICVVASTLTAEQAWSASRIALVIGNNSYPKLVDEDGDRVGDLQKAVADADATRRVLQDLRFEVMYLENATLSELKQAGFELTRRLGKEDIAFVFYAGHGVHIDGTNYLLPSDVPQINEPQNERDLAFEKRRVAEFSLPETFFADRIREAGAKIGLLVMDACRNNPIRVPESNKSTRSAFSGDIVVGHTRGLGVPSSAEGLFFLYSAGFQQEALDGLRNQRDDSPNSPFTRTFLKKLSQPNVDFFTIAKETQSAVAALAASDNHRQVPAIYEQILGGKIYLNGTPQNGDVEPNTNDALNELQEQLDLLKREKEAAVRAATAAKDEAKRLANLKEAENNISTAYGNDGFLFPSSHYEPIETYRLTSLSKGDLRIARNEIYARRGRFFKSSDLQQHFGAFSWYRPHTWTPSLNKIEKANVKRIQREEKSR